MSHTHTQTHIPERNKRLTMWFLDMLYIRHATVCVLGTCSNQAISALSLFICLFVKTFFCYFGSFSCLLTHTIPFPYVRDGDFGFIHKQQQQSQFPIFDTDTRTQLHIHYKRATPLRGEIREIGLRFFSLSFECCQYKTDLIECVQSWKKNSSTRSECRGSKTKRTEPMNDKLYWQTTRCRINVCIAIRFGCWFHGLCDGIELELRFVFCIFLTSIRLSHWHSKRINARYITFTLTHIFSTNRI